jgi:transcriptional regulator with XRE-family HTH domain
MPTAELTMTDETAPAEVAGSAAERLAEEIRARRTDAGLSQARLAARIGYTPAYISLAERPEKGGLPSAAVVQAIDNALGADGALVNLREQAEADQQTLRGQASTPKLVGLVSAAAGQPALDAVDQLVPRRGYPRVDHKLVLGHYEVAQAFASLYRGADPRSVLPIATVYADDILTLLDAPMGESDRTELGGIVAGIHAQIGLWACHMHRPAMAYRYLATACQIADGTPDRALQARTLGAFSYYFSSAPRGGHGGDARRAVSLLTQALALAGRADAFTVGWLATWRADQHATLGNLNAAQRDIELADQQLNAADNGPAAGFFARSVYGYGMQDHCDSVRAVAFALAGETEEAIRTFNQVQSHAANMRRRIATYGHQALAQVRTHEPDAACATLSHAVHLAVENYYIMGLERAMGVRTGFDSDWSNLNCVRDFDKQFRQQLKHLKLNGEPEAWSMYDWDRPD